MKRSTILTAAAALFTLALTCSPAKVSAQSAGSWVDIAKGSVGAGANADGMFQIAKTRSSSKNGVDFGHGFALGAGPNGLALSNSIGVGGAGSGAAHNVQLNIGRNGTHVSHGGVVTQGGNRRVVAGGHTGSNNGQVYGGSHATGYGHNTNAYSKSKSRPWGVQQLQSQNNNNQNSYSQPTYSQPSYNPPTYSQTGYGQPVSSQRYSSPARVIRGGGIRMFGR